MNCPSCDGPAPDGARFCPACGSVLATSRLEERRVVTVLFADVVGFTSLAEHRDPEQVKRIIDSCMERLVADIAAFGGTVDKILGDGILALFGAPVAHEDDAQRAVRAALRMQQTIGTAVSDGPRLQLRIGVNTGEVLVGALRARADYTAMGDVVNIASRLQAAAPPGRVLVGETTRHLTDDAISYEPFGDVDARGRIDAVPAWLAGETLALPGGRRHRQDIPFVGRDDELGLLASGLTFAIGRRRAFLAAIEGEGGVGKSRIVSEVVGLMRSEYKMPVLEGSCVPYGEDNAWWPLASAIVGHLDFDLDAPIDRVREHARVVAGDLFGLDSGPDLARAEDALVHLLGFPSSLDGLEPARAREIVGRLVVNVLRALLRRGPLGLSITDLHWADPALITTLENVLVAVSNLPLVVLTTTRPESDLVWPPAWGNYSAVRLRLEPLDLDAAHDLVGSILGADVDPDVVRRLYERSGGNPLFLEELATLVAEHGTANELPDSLRALVAARLDQLPPGERSVLDNAAVLGGSGTVAGLVAYGRRLGIDNTEQLLLHLVDAGMLAVESSRWRFRSESVREVAYHTLTKSARAHRHAKIADALADAGFELSVRTEDVAHHYAAAAELVAELGRIDGVRLDVGERAVHWSLEASAWAADQMHPRSAVRIATRALDLIGADEDPTTTPARRRLLLVRADALSDLRSLDRARVDVEAALALAEEASDRGDEGDAHRLLGEINRLEGRPTEARHELDRSIEMARQLGDDAQLAKALRSRGFLEVFGGTPVDAAEFLDEADDLYLKLGDRTGHAWVEQNRAWMSFLAGHISAADERLHRAAAAMEELGDRGGIGWAFGLLAYVRFYAGNREEAAQIAESVMRDAGERGDDWAVGMMQSLQANLQLWEGRTTAALQLAESARTRMRRLGDGYGQVQALAPIVRALAALGRSAEARTMAEELAALAPRFGLEGFVALAGLGAALHSGNVERALEASTRALDIERSRGGIGSAEVLLGRALAQVMAGRIDEASAMLELAAGDEAGHPYGAAVLALLEARSHRWEQALAAASVVAEQPGATYLDRIFGLLAEAAARAHRDDEAGAVIALEQARLISAGTDDLVAREIVAIARRALGADPPAEPAFVLPGWHTLITALFPPPADDGSGAPGVRGSSRESGGRGT